MCSGKVCCGVQASRKVKEIAKALLDLKKTFGTEREQLKLRIIERFKLEANEKWVATKLRLMLIKSGSCKDLLEIGRNEKKMLNRARISHQKQMALSRKSTGSEKNVLSQRVKKPRQSLKEKQLIKLRTLSFDEHISDSVMNSKIKFLEAFSLVPVMIAL